MAKLTKAFIEKVQPPAGDYRIHWDDAVPGYGLRVTPQGKRVFVAMGRVKGKSVQITIGTFGVFTEDQARKRAQKLLQQMREGIDPRDVEKEDDAARVTLRQVADVYFARPGMLRETTRVEMDRHVEQVFAAWRDKPIAAISESNCRQRYGEMATRGLRGKGPAPGQAQLSMTTLSTLINFARRRFRRADGSLLIRENPVTPLKADWPRMKPRTRDIGEGKVGAVWSMLSELRVAPKNADALAGIDLVMFLMMTGARRNEGAMLEWRNVNLDEGWFHLPNPKNDNPVWIPLSSQAIALLRSRKRVEGNPHVFPSRGATGHVMDTRAPLERISKLIEQPLSAHDLRRTFVSVGVATLGLDLYKMELLTNHVPKGVTARHYLRTSRLQYLLPETQRISDWIEGQAAVASGANVVPLRAA